MVRRCRARPHERIPHLCHPYCLYWGHHSHDAAWSLADITMGGMTLINLPACVALSGVVIKAYKDYEKQKAQGLDPVFKAESIGMDPEELDFWK